MPGLTGVSTRGVGSDLVNYLQEVAKYFGVTIRVTSGYRSPQDQAEAMFNNWVKLKHGQVYKASTLPKDDRSRLDALWADAHDSTKTASEKDKAKTDFLDHAKATVGSKSMHTRGRAIDVSRHGISGILHRAILLRLHEVKEGNRTDIFHFESLQSIPAVDASMKAQWQALRGGAPQTSQKTTCQSHGPRC